MQLTDTANTVLEKRYYVEEDNKSWEGLCKRISNFFGKTQEERAAFYSVMFNRDFLPNSPALMNAGTSIKSYSACYVLPIEDNINSIYKFYADAAKINKSGGGVGANYSKIRAKNAAVQSTNGVASGPLSFMEVQDKSTDIIKQGGRRRGANMGILDCDHPDIFEFVTAKEDKGKLNNYNLSVRITDDFMSKINEEGSHEKKLWDILCEKAWKSAEPGVFFGDTAERGNTVPYLGKLEATNPCGEQVLLPYENCCLGSINLSNFIKGSSIRWNRLKDVASVATLFLNRVLDKSVLPIPECQKAMENTRKIGLGIMGLHDLLIQKGLAYDSEEGRKTAGSVMSYIGNIADEVSTTLGSLEGTYKGYKEGERFKRRNANLTTIAPTGTLSMIADCSSGIEPYYSVITIKNVLDGEKLILINKWFEPALLKQFGKEETDKIIEKVKIAGTINIPEVPDDIKSLFKGANDIAPKDHVLMQAEMQKFVDSSISKTINMPQTSSINDVREVYELAYKSGCKGITVYRDGSRDQQVLTVSNIKTMDSLRPDKIVYNLAPKRPKVLPAEIHHCNIKGVPWIVIVGLLDGYPYELFAGELNDLFIPKTCRIGTITKAKSNTYSLNVQIGKSDVEIKDIANILMNSEQKALTRMISLALRHGCHYEFIVGQLEKASGEITDFSAAVNRVLKKYIKTFMYAKTQICTECGGEIAFVEGCSKCLGCGASKCG